MVIFSDFSKILREATKKPVDGVHVLIERAPECKSVYVSGFLKNTSKEQVETYFDKLGALENVVFNRAWDEEGKDKRAIVYFKEKKSKSKKIRSIYDYASCHAINLIKASFWSRLSKKVESVTRLGTGKR